uniref:BHLH domain-containing protein n=1 Tax=Amphora coffeiformis TaxID=265554 RepID=A0A7S3KX76_9STRA|mmetsp:Transcript_1508/g.3363  ORF Transcript_1508/g.3363 Transcript_1508/m.3363 type:complete len:529 (-) Transcript_1508:325-1911(-)
MSSPTSSSDDNQQGKTNTETLSSDDGGAPRAISSSGNDSTGSQSANNNTRSDSLHAYRKSNSNESGGSGGSNHSSGMLSSFGFNFYSDSMMQLGGSSLGVPSEKTSEGENSDSSEKQQRKNNSTDANAAADANVANLQSLARSQFPLQGSNNESSRKRNEPDRDSGQSEQSRQSQQGQYHQYDQNKQNDESVASQDNDYDDDDDDDHQSRSTAEPRSSNDSPQPKRRKKRLDERKRVERNAREKERSFRISKQINELRGLLSSGGVIVPKGTKSSVLTEAANYIRMLQQHQYRSEIDRHQLIQQMQLIGGGAHGAQAAQAIRHVAAQNGVWSLGNFGGIPPKSALLTPNTEKSNNTVTEDAVATDPNKVNTNDYRFIFNSCGVGMAIASMGGAFIDCNQLFCQLSNYTKQEVCSLTIFNLTARQDLQHAFDLISQLISPRMEGPVNKAISVRGSFKNRNDLGLCVNIVKGEDGIAKCFCVTVIKNPNSPFNNEPPVPVSFESIIADSQQNTLEKNPGQVGTAPAFTSG